MLVVLLQAAALGLPSAGPKPRNPKCTCDDPSLCESLPPVAAGSPQPAEALAFYSGEVSPPLLPLPPPAATRHTHPTPHARFTRRVTWRGPPTPNPPPTPTSPAGQLGGQVYGANGSEWQVFDWNKTTAIGMYDGKAEYNYGELQCVAHKHGARILDWNQASAAFGKLGFGRRDPAFLGNATAVGIYADYMANYVSTAGIDGVILDIETGNTSPPALLKALRAGNTALTCALKKALVAKVPGAVLTWAMPARVTADDAYDYKAIMDCGADYLTPMACETDTDTPSLSRFACTLTRPRFRRELGGQQGIPHPHRPRLRIAHDHQRPDPAVRRGLQEARCGGERPRHGTVLGRQRVHVQQHCRLLVRARARGLPALRPHAELRP